MATVRYRNKDPLPYSDFEGLTRSPCGPMTVLCIYFFFFNQLSSLSIDNRGSLSISGCDPVKPGDLDYAVDNTMITIKTNCILTSTCLLFPERSDDGHAHAESRVFAIDPRADGRYRMVQGQLLVGPGSQLGQKFGLRFRDEKL